MSDDAKSEITDNVIMGDFTHIANKIDSELRVTCESCHASGNFTIFVCNSTDCTNKFCEHCKDSVRPKKCRVCIQEILDKEEARLLSEQKVAAAAAAAAERVRKLDEEAAFAALEAERIDYENERWAAEIEERHKKKMKLIHYNSTSARFFRLRNFIWPLEYLICLYILFIVIEPPDESSFWYVFGAFIIYSFFSWLITYVSLTAGTVTQNKDIHDPHWQMNNRDLKDYLTSMAATGYAPIRVSFFLLSPIFSMNITLLFILFFGLQILLYSSMMFAIIAGLGVLFTIANTKWN